MAAARLERYEIEQGLLPPLCMRCGVEATAQARKRFSWYPGWVNILIFLGLLPWAIVAMILTRRMTVYAPLCDGHKNHWAWRSWFIWLGLGLIAFLGAGGLIILIASGNRRGPWELLGGLVCAAAAVGGLGWLIAAAIVQQTGIRPTEITDSDITLVNVSHFFKQALQADRYYREGRPWYPPLSPYGQAPPYIQPPYGQSPLHGQPPPLPRQGGEPGEGDDAIWDPDR